MPMWLFGTFLCFYLQATSFIYTDTSFIYSFWTSVVSNPGVRWRWVVNFHAAASLLMGKKPSATRWDSVDWSGHVCLYLPGNEPRSSVAALRFKLLWLSCDNVYGIIIMWLYRRLFLNWNHNVSGVFPVSFFTPLSFVLIKNRYTIDEMQQNTLNYS
jgi:hypothetical protein